MLVHGVDCKAPTFKLSLAIAEVLNPTSAQSQIFPKLLLVHEIHSFQDYSIQELGNIAIHEAFNELFVDGALKPEHQNLETKGLAHISHIPRDFQVKWIKIILRCVHNGQLYLDQPIQITKKMIHRITRLTMLNKAKMTKTLGQVELAK